MIKNTTDKLLTVALNSEYGNRGFKTVVRRAVIGYLTVKASAITFRQHGFTFTGKPEKGNHTSSNDYT